MSQETYTFACPVCAVRLSVPKALAGVRGPCPQCHHDITAPEPESAVSAAMVGAGVSQVVSAAASVKGNGVSPGRSVPPPLPPSSSPSMVSEATRSRPGRIEAPEPSDPVPPPVPTDASARESAEAPEAPVSDSPPSLAESGFSTPEKGVEVELPTPPPLPSTVPMAVPPPPSAEPLEVEPLAAVPAPVPPALDEADRQREVPRIAAASRPLDRPLDRPAPVARRSRLWLAAAALGLVGLLALAALNLLPRHSLRTWLGKAVPLKVVESVLGPESGGPPSTASPAPLNEEAGSSPASFEIRPALSLPDAGIPSESTAETTGPADSAPEASPETVATPASTNSAPPPETTPAPTEPAPADPPAAPGPVEVAAAPPGGPSAPSTPPETGTPSLLPDISVGRPPEAAAVNEAQAGAQEALTLFLQARTWKDRLALSHGSDSLGAEMEAYYRKTKDGPNQPTSVEHIASAPLPDGVRTVEVFHVTFSDLPQGFPVPVRQTDDGWRIDWQAFVEFREGRLKKFLAQYQDAPAIFRVRLQRAHYQDRGVPNLEGKYIFRIAAPIDGHEGYVFVDKDDSIAGPKLEDKLQWDAIHHVMVKLKWVRGTTGRSYVELRDIVSNSWREQP